MQSERTLERVSEEAVTELQQAARDTAGVVISENDDRLVTLRGDQAAFEQLAQSLWIRELSAREHGQDGLAEADQSARVSLKRAESTPHAEPTPDAGTRATSLSD